MTGDVADVPGHSSRLNVIGARGRIGDGAPFSACVAQRFASTASRAAASRRGQPLPVATRAATIRPAASGPRPAFSRPRTRESRVAKGMKRTA